MERSLPTDAFATGRRLGLGAGQYADHYTWAASVYGQEVGDDSSGNSPYGIGARVTWAPWAEKTKVVHLGLSGAWENPEDEGVSYSTRPESHRTDTKFANTGGIPDPDNFTELPTSDLLVVIEQNWSMNGLSPGDTNLYLPLIVKDLSD